MTYTPDNLKLWTLPDSYMGAHWPEYYVFLGQHRDSEALDRSNFTCGLEAIGGETDTVLVVHESHWAVGWVEWIAIHKSDTNALKQADETAAALLDYPVVNESHYCDLEYTEACGFWASLPVSERLWYCQKAYISPFAARHDYLPEDPDGTLLEYLTRS